MTQIDPKGSFEPIGSNGSFSAGLARDFRFRTHRQANPGHRNRAFFTQNLCERAISIPRFYSRRPRMRTEIHTWSAAMDIAYLLFLLVLFGAVFGFLLICDRLGTRR
jgi:hypothetical protein